MVDATRIRKRPQRNMDLRASGVELFSSENSKESIHEQSMKAFDSNQIPNEWEDYTGSDNIGGGKKPIDPPYNPYSLMRLPNQNNTLKQCIEAMVTNVEGFGYRLEYIGDGGQEDSLEAEAEKLRLENFLDYPNEDSSLTEIREKLRRDLETFGYAFLEVTRDSLRRVNTIYHLPAHTVRLTKRDEEPVELEIDLPRHGLEETKKQKRRKYFRRFMQVVGSKKIYFKEFSDPRVIDYRTGIESKVALEDSANEVIHLSLHNAGEIYGLPRWINQIPSVMGSRESELTNLQYFKDNAIPAMAVMVSGGYLTQETLDSITQHFEAVRGREAQNRVLLIEAQADESDADEDGRLPVPRIDMKPLNDARQKDGLFQQYEENNAVKIRSSFRIPPIFLGRSDDYTRATADTSLVVAESQVFGPERKKVDDIMNLKLLASYEPKYWKFRSLPPKITGAEDIMAALRDLNTMGAVTPNIAIGMANELFDLEIELVPDDWGNYPFQLVEKLVGKDDIALPSLGNESAEEDDALAEDNQEELDSIDVKVAKKLRGIKRRISND